MRAPPNALGWRYEGREEACRLAAAIDDALYRRGFPKEKRHFETHLTIGRVRGATPGERQQLGRLLADQHDFDCGLTSVREVLVMSSQLSPAGPTYGVLQRCPLRPPDQS